LGPEKKTKNHARAQVYLPERLQWGDCFDFLAYGDIEVDFLSIALQFSEFVEF